MIHRSLIPAVIALVLLVAVGVGYGLLYNMLHNARTQVTELSAQVEARTQQAAQVAAAKDALFTLSADEAFFRSYFVSTSTIVSYLEELETTGEELGSTVEIVSVVPEAKDRLSVSLKIAGSFRAVMRTLGAIEFGPHDTRAGTVTLSSIAEEWTATAIFSVGTRSTATP